MNLASALPCRFKTGLKSPFGASLRHSTFQIRPSSTPLSPQTPSHPVSTPRPGPTRPGPLKSNFLAVVRFVGNKISGYEKLTGNNEKVFAGVSIDKTYGGVHVRNIFNAVFINPLSFDPQSIEEAVGVALHCMIHEINHTNVSEEGANFTTSLAVLYGKIYGTGKYGYFEGLVRSVYGKHFETFKQLKKQYDKSSTRNISKSFTGEQISTSSPGSVQSNETAIPNGESSTGRNTRDRADNTK